MLFMRDPERLRYDKIKTKKVKVVPLKEEQDAFSINTERLYFLLEQIRALSERACEYEDYNPSISDNFNINYYKLKVALLRKDFEDAARTIINLRIIIAIIYLTFEFKDIDSRELLPELSIVIQVLGELESQIE